MPERIQLSRKRGPGIPVFYGPAMVAQWTGVTRATISNWLRRYQDYPEPAGISRGPKRDSPLWRKDQREAWLKWAKDKDVSMGYLESATREDSDCG